MTPAQHAVRVGTVVLNVPIVVLVLAPGFLAPRFGIPNRSTGFLVGLLIGWLVWSLTIPRWRRWALRRGADPEELQRRAVAAGLVWPRGWIFEKTEIPPRRDTDIY